MDRFARVYIYIYICKMYTYKHTYTTDNQPTGRSTGDATPLRITIETKRWEDAKAIVLRITRQNALQMERDSRCIRRR